MGDAYELTDMDVERSRLQRGEIPSYFVNSVTLYSDGAHIYAYLDAHSQLKKYTIDGELVWKTSIDFPSNKVVFETAVMRAREEGMPGTVPAYQFMTSMKVVSGTTYLLSSPADGHPRYIARVNKSGEIDKAYHFHEDQPMIHDIAVDTEQNMLYATAPELGQVYRARLPQ
jgi:hypothetical protein